MTTPLAIVADSIIEFILSLLRDPAAVAALKDDPDGTLARHGVEGLCVDDIRAVAPVVYDRPDVALRAPTPSTRSGNDTPTPRSSDDPVVRELVSIANNFTMIDNRATIVDQSVNQNIWTEGGDVTQVFDQSAGVASGDGAVAAGEDIETDSSVDNSVDVDVDVDVDMAGTDPAALDAVVGAATDVAGTDVADAVGGADVPAEAATDAAAAAAQAAVVAEPAPVEEAVDAASFEAPAVEAPAVEAPAIEVDESVWDTTEAIAEEEPMYEDEILEDQ